MAKKKAKMVRLTAIVPKHLRDWLQSRVDDPNDPARSMSYIVNEALLNMKAQKESGND